MGESINQEQDNAFKKLKKMSKEMAIRLNLPSLKLLPYHSCNLSESIINQMEMFFHAVLYLTNVSIIIWERI
jgi:hypothetical protein